MSTPLLFFPLALPAPSRYSGRLDVLPPSPPAGLLRADGWSLTWSPWTAPSRPGSSPAAPQGYSLTPHPRVHALCRCVAADLASVDRSVTPWIVLGLHRMMWAPATWWHDAVGDLDNEERLQVDLEELFLAHGVSEMDGGHCGPWFLMPPAAACCGPSPLPTPQHTPLVLLGWFF